jgi:RNA polymerase sigma factor (sigma-70 family)
MRIAPRGSSLVQGESPREARSANDEPVGNLARMDAVRSWLVSGIHLFVVDPRRRLGEHGRAKELLIVDSRERHDDSDHSHKLAAALHRHTLRGGLAQLSPEERRLITLAYLDGRTNRQIASAMGVSVSTVRRRLGAALESLEIYISRSGAWLSAVVLLLASSATGRAARLGRSAASFVGRADWAEKLAATLAAGALATAALGLVGVTSDSATPKSAPGATGHFVFPTTESAQALGSSPSAPRTVVLAQDRSAVTTVRGGRPDPPALGTTATKTVVAHPNNGCDGNPTSAPPRVPVASKNNHPTGAPVTHPTAGGCRA